MLVGFLRTAGLAVVFCTGKKEKISMFDAPRLGCRGLGKTQ